MLQRSRSFSEHENLAMIRRAEDKTRDEGLRNVCFGLIDKSFNILKRD